MPEANYWKREARKVVDRVIADRGANHPELESIIDAAYPFGSRGGHLHSVWREEVKGALRKSGRKDVGTPTRQLCLLEE